MILEEVKQHIRQWVENTLSVPSPAFQNLPPCPYSRQALLKNKVDIRCGHGAELLDYVKEIGRTWDDSHELVLVACEPETIRPEELIVGIERMNAAFESADLVCFFDHPDCTDPKYKVTSANGKYVLVGMQRLQNFIQAAKPLFKKNYFEQVNKQYSATKHLSKADSAGRKPQAPIQPSNQLPIETIENLQFKRFSAFLEEVCANSKYYSEKFKEAAVGPSDIESWADLHKLPTLDTKTLLARNPDLPAVPNARLRRVIVSGGTTGSPKVCFFADNLQEILETWATAWQSTGLTEEDRVAVLCPLPLASGILITELLEGIGCSTLPLGLTTPPEVSARLMQRLGVTAIVTQPSTLRRFAQEIRQFGYDPRELNIKRVLLGSEVLTKRIRTWVEEEWGCEVFDTSGSSEAGMIGAECGEHDGHHLAVGSAYFEVLDLETERPIREGLGQLYTTTLLNVGLPLIRYDMKDIVKVTSEPCGCGATTPRIWFMGRTDDRLVFKTGVKFYSYQLDEALEAFDGITMDYNVIATERDGVDSIKLIIEVPDGAQTDSELAQKLAEAVIDLSVDFKELYEAELVRVPEVELVATGALERTPRGKIKSRFRDLRAVDDPNAGE